MLERLSKHIEQNELFSKNDKLLLAFSGGVDSVVLSHLLLALGYKFDLAHCNFNLRGKESKGDEKFCADLAKKAKLNFLSQQFETKKFAAENDLSIQMAARQLRYDWFKSLVQKNKYKYVLTAHHANDNVETLLINLIRGTGINGLKGIPEKQDHLVRPLLFASKDEIIAYAKTNKLKYREDSSNDEVKYKRNFLRHNVIPKLKELNPALERTFEQNIKLFKESADIVKQFTDSKKEEIVSEKNAQVKIDIKKLEKERHKELLLFEFIHPYGFNASQTGTMLKSVSTKLPGKLFFSDSHKILIDRSYLIIEAIKNSEQQKEFQIKDRKAFQDLPFDLSTELISNFEIESNKKIAQLDLNKLEFPLIVRKWQTGDKFKPLGVNGFKKLSDFFTDQKLNQFEKEDVWLLLNKNDIVWVIGYRIDDRYKINEQTKKILKLKLEN